MKLLPSVGGIESFALLAALGIGGYVLYRVYKGGLALGKQVGEVVSTDLNPASDKNLVYRSANATFFGDKKQTIGGAVYDFFHSGSKDKVAEMLNSKPASLPPTTPANGQPIAGVSDLRTSRTNTGTVDANPLTRTKANSYSWQG
jgi:hypothetical protein